MLLCINKGIGYMIKSVLNLLFKMLKYAEMSLINAYTDVFRGAIGLKLVWNLYLHLCFVYSRLAKAFAAC